MSHIPNDSKDRNPEGPPKKKVYGDPIYNDNQDITNQGKRVQLNEVKNDGEEPDIKKLYGNDLNTAEQEITTNQQTTEEENKNIN